MGIYDGFHAKPETKDDVLVLTSTGWDANNQRVQNIATPVVGNDAVTLDYVNNKYLDKATGGSVLGSINMNGNTVFGIENPPPYDSAAVSKEYIDNNKIIDSNGTLRYDINMGARLINRQTIPINNTELVHKGYVDTHTSQNYLNKRTGGTMESGINMNDNNLFGLSNPPSFNTSAASKE